MPGAVDLAREIRDLVAQIPAGRVSTFADLAAGLGDPRAAMAVHRILRDAPAEGIHRVVRADGEVPFAGARALLRREGVTVRDGRVEGLDRIAWREFRGPRTLAILRGEQRRLAAEVDAADRVPEPRRIAGFDLAYDGDSAFVAAVVMDPEGEVVLQEVALRVTVAFPYIPGYLAYREFPAIGTCFGHLDPPPDVLMIDGHGVLHPARCGIASFVGLTLDRPAIGVAKSLLVGEAGPAPARPGDWTGVTVDREVLGAAIRSGTSKRTIYVSVGHAISLETAVRITTRLCKTRIPEPLRRADRLAGEEKRN